MAKTTTTKEKSTPKKVSKKAGTVKKVPLAKKTESKKTASETKKRKDLIALINQIDEEGLLFLKQQASILIHNQAIEEQRLEQKKGANNKSKAIKKDKSVEDSSEQETHKTKASTKSTPGKPTIEITIEPGQNMQVFYIVTDLTRGFFNKTEFKTIVKVCQNAKEKTAARKNLYKWLRKERGDFLQDAQIDSIADVRLGLIIDAILKDYKI